MFSVIVKWTILKERELQLFRDVGGRCEGGQKRQQKRDKPNLRAKPSFRPHLLGHEKCAQAIYSELQEANVLVTFPEQSWGWQAF